jgi:bloom syndrome protein
VSCSKSSWLLTFASSSFLLLNLSHPHTVFSKTGHDFRPDYAKLGVLKRHFPSVPILAVTATASEKVRADCIGILGMHPTDHAYYRSTANRPNLTYQIRVKDDSTASTKKGGTVMDDMAAFIKESHPYGAGIVYTYSKKDADTVADHLCERGIVARSYHSEYVSSLLDFSNGSLDYILPDKLYSHLFSVPHFQCQQHQ